MPVVESSILWVVAFAENMEKLLAIFVLESANLKSWGN
jgi:hypothetical protein